MEEESDVAVCAWYELAKARADCSGEGMATPEIQA